MHTAWWNEPEMSATERSKKQQTYLQKRKGRSRLPALFNNYRILNLKSARRVQKRVHFQLQSKLSS